MAVSHQIGDSPNQWMTDRRVQDIEQNWEVRCDLGEFDGLTYDEQTDAWAKYNSELICAIEDGIIFDRLIVAIAVSRRRDWKRLARAKKQRRTRCGRK